MALLYINIKNIFVKRIHAAISIKVVPEQGEKVEYERERLLGIAEKIINFLALPSKPFALVFDFSALLGTTLIEKAVYSVMQMYLDIKVPVVISWISEYMPTTT